jgi:toxin ParE1/3/4
VTARAYVRARGSSYPRRIAIDTLSLTGLIDRLVEGMSTSADFPRPGRSRREIAPGVRALVEGDHLILYRVDGRDVDIVRVVHGARRLTERAIDRQTRPSSALHRRLSGDPSARRPVGRIGEGVL